MYRLVPLVVMVGCGSGEPASLELVGFAEDRNCPTMTSLSDGTVVATCDEGTVWNPDGTFVAMNGLDGDAITQLWHDPKDGTLYGQAPRPSSGQPGTFYKLVGTEWQVYAKIPPERASHTNTPFAVDPQGRIVVGFPQLQRWEPTSDTWSDIEPAGIYPVTYQDDGIAVGRDGLVYVAVEDGIYTVGESNALEPALVCMGVDPAPSGCTGQLGTVSHPDRMKNGRDGDIYWIIGRTIHDIPILWRWNNGNPVKAANGDTAALFTGWDVSKNGTVYFSQRECNGCDYSWVTRYGKGDPVHATVLLDELPGDNYWPKVGFDDARFVWAPNSDQFRGIYRVVNE